MRVEEIVFDVFELNLSDNNSVEAFFSKLLLILVLFQNFQCSVEKKIIFHPDHRGMKIKARLNIKSFGK